MKVAIGTISFFTNNILFDLFQRSFNTVITTHPALTMNVINHPVTPVQDEFLKVRFGHVFPYYRNNVSLAWNKMINEALANNCNRILITNSDLFFQEGAIDKMLEFSETSGNFIVGARPYSDPGYTLPAYTDDAVHYCNFVLNLDRWDEWLEKDPDERCAGYFDVAKFDPAYYEDIDFNRRAWLANMGIGLCPEAKCHHLVSQSQRLDPETAERIRVSYSVCQNNYIQKWGGDIGQETLTVPFNF